MWEGQTVAVLASGPSMSQAVADQVHGYGLPAIAVNNTWQLAPWAQVLYAADAQWWQHNPKALDFAGLKVSVKTGEPLPKAVHALRQTGYEGFDPDPGCVRVGGNSGYQAVHVAANAGAKTILLLGFDMHGTHWHGEHRPPLRETGPATYDRWSRVFETLKTPAEIVNCTPGSRIECFRMDRLESFKPAA